jgi:polyhydroxybutyrate depolymerase
VVSKRVLSASLALGLAASGCGPEHGTGPGAPDSVASPGGSGGSSAGTPGTPGSGGSSAGSAGSSAGAPTGAGAAGSNGGSTGGGMPSPSSSGAPGTVPSAGCARAPEFQSGTQQIEVGGLSRAFILDLPGDYDRNESYPLVFGFHGRDFTAADFRGPEYGNLLSATGDEAILVHPDATAALGAWDLESPQDVVFFDAMLEALTEGLCVDETRVFATGHSSGGYFTNLLGCQRGDVLRAIAPLAGAGPFGPDDAAPACERPVSVMVIHAEDDEIVPFVNGEGSLDYWLGSDHCDPQSFQPVAPDPCVAYAGCASGLAVRWCVYQGGHDWPSFAAQGIWDFFKSF